MRMLSEPVKKRFGTKPVEFLGRDMHETNEYCKIIRKIFVIYLHSARVGWELIRVFTGEFAPT